MTPTKFREANSTLLGDGDGVADLATFKDGYEVISCWKASWLERAQVLLTGRVWLRVLARTTHAPVLLQTETPEQVKP